jgi:hypothetical protein
MVRALKQLNYSPKVFFQTSAPSNAGQYSEGIGVENTEGVFYTVSWNEKAKTPLNQEFLAEYAKMFNNELPAEDAADAFAAAQVLQAAVVAVGKIDQKALADWLHANKVQTILVNSVGCELGRHRRVPARPVAERQGGDRRSGGPGDNHQRRQPQARLAVIGRCGARSADRAPHQH